MMVNVTNLKAVTNGALTGPALHARQKSIINNAIRELLYAVGYNGPFRDNDQRVAMAVESAIQHLEGPETSTSEHASLAPVGVITSPVIDRISSILENGIEDELRDFNPSQLTSITLSDPQSFVTSKSKKDNNPT